MGLGDGIIGIGGGGTVDNTTGEITVNSGASEITEAVGATANQYEDALDDLLTAAAGGSMNLAETTILTTQAQQQQAILEMVQGVAKAATSQLKDLGKRIG